MSGGLGSRTTAPQPYLEDADFTLYNGDALETLKTLEAESVHCVVTSPPYWGLRDYGTGAWEGGDPDCDHARPTTTYNQSFNERWGQGGGQKKQEKKSEGQYAETCGKCGASRVDNQLGLEPTPDAYLERMVAVFREVRRVLRGDGVCWVNMGDSYASSPPGNVAGVGATSGLHGANDPNGKYRETLKAGHATKRSTVVAGLKPKDLCMIPARLALALQADGWWLRSQVVWSKPNPMPESVTDRPTTSHEFVYLLAKSPRYFFDQEAVREPHNDKQGLERFNGSGGSTEGYEPGHQGWVDGGGFKMKPGARDYNPSGRNLRSVWEIPTQPYPEAHFATYPEELVRRCILAGTSEKGCCSECGKPWERVTSESLVASARKPDKKAYPSPREGAGGDQGHARSSSHVAGLSKSVETLGWEPQCECGQRLRAYQMPCTVLDPFCGSGTTALVARKHGRRTIGIELSVEYCELASRRLSQLSLLAESV